MANVVGYQSPPSKPDTTTSWINQYTDANGVVKPALLLRTATDSNYIFNKVGNFGGLYGVPYKAMFSCVTPGMRIPGVLSWSVNESVEAPTQTASIEILNALQISRTSTTLTNTMQGTEYFNQNGSFTTYARDSSGVVHPYWNTGNLDDVVFRVFQGETVAVSSNAGWPDPRVPNEEADVQNPTNSYWTASATGQGAYFILIDQEVMRVTDGAPGSNYFIVPPGGRGVNGIIQPHGPGATVTLLDLGESTGQYVGLGYMTADDYRPYTCMIRPGVCLVSYEGYGSITGTLSKGPWTSGNYCFTGYWFTGTQESKQDTSGQPTLSLSCLSAGYVMTEQKINQDSVFRLNSTLGYTFQQAAFDEVGYKRSIPGDWEDYNFWQSNLPNSYPLKIEVTYAQHKRFFDHMNETNFGTTCEYCVAEYQNYQAEHPGGAGSLNELRQIGRHIYKESIRVYRGQGSLDPGPVKTYLRLMTALAIAVWEDPLYGNPLQQRWTKMPTALFNNMLNYNTGRVWSGRIGYHFQDDQNYKFGGEGTIGYQILDDITNNVQTAIYPFTCPFTASYDNQQWFQPCIDFAQMNDMWFMWSRQGFPILVPKNTNMRGISGQRGEWHMSQGESIESFSDNMSVEAVITLCYVTCTTCFDSTISIAAAGTGIDLTTSPSQKIWYSSKVGNRDGIQITGGVQKIDTRSMDNLSVGLDWNTDPAGFSLNVIRDNVKQAISVFPAVMFKKILSEHRTITKADKEVVISIQKLANFFLTRRLISAPVTADGTYYPQLNTDGVFGPDLTAAIKLMQALIKVTVTGTWNKTTATTMRHYLAVNGQSIATDVWWYVMGGYDWQYYVAAITGMAIPQTEQFESDGTTTWIVDQLALKSAVGSWQERFLQDIISFGNTVVDDSITASSVKSFSSSLADPRIELGDVVWLEVPGFMTGLNIFGNTQSPFTHGVLVTQVTRSIDLQAGTSKSSYAGKRYLGDFDTFNSKNTLNYYRG